MTTKTPITTDGWYEHTDGTYGHYAGAARGLGPCMTIGPYPDYECVHRAPDGAILRVGWPARARLAAAAGVDQDELTPELARTAIDRLRAERRDAQWLARQELV